MRKPSRSSRSSKAVVRRRPLLTTTCAPDVVAELQRRAREAGANLSAVTEAALRIGLGLPPAPVAATP